ncbi:MAG: penicillin-binding transpeptidase domain-containing protein [Rhodoferax sp.]|nr:penicillin-binding transpeptidase domain-containing protein [Rhodoferax sp.]
MRTPADDRLASYHSPSPTVQARQHVWWGLSRSVLSLSLAILALGAGAVWVSLQRDLPNTLSVAKYLGKAVLRFDKPQEVHNTWQALPGCVRMADGSYWPMDATSAVACAGTATPEASRPPGLSRLAEVLAVARRSGAEHTPPASAQGQNAPQGRSVQLTLQPVTQALAQAHAECFIGQADKCAQLGITTDHWRDHFEQAAARSVGVLVLDVTTGGIEAMASAMSPCYLADYSSRAARASGCPDLPQAPTERPYMTTTRALGEAMIASPDKMALSLGLLRDPLLGPQLQGRLRGGFMQAIKTSDNAWFFDQLFCKDAGFGPCQRPTLALQAAQDLGLNTHCQTPSAKCGVRNLLGADETRTAPGQYPVLAGRLFVQPESAGSRQFVNMPPKVLRDYPHGTIARCSAQKWEECTQGASFIDLLSEAYGQGNALASPLGVATMLGQLARAANTAPGQAVTAMQPHLAMAESDDTSPSVVPIHPAHARLILQGMSLTHQSGGSAYLACLRAHDMQAKACTHQRVAGKTGTPQFRQHALTLAQRKALCSQVKAGSPEAARCRMRPYKWYAAAVKSSAAADAPWDKVVVVLSERNYNQRTGYVDSPKDKGTPNVSAELGLRFIRSVYLEPKAQATMQNAPKANTARAWATPGARS